MRMKLSMERKNGKSFCLSTLRIHSQFYSHIRLEWVNHQLVAIFILSTSLLAATQTQLSSNYSLISMSSIDDKPIVLVICLSYFSN